jgi:HSP20 family protein
MVERTVAMPESQQGTLSTEQMRTRERYITPPVDIYETPESLVVIADIPDAAQEDLEVRVDNNVLTIQGRAKPMATEGTTYREYELVNVFRQFALTDTVDQAKITAALNHGVLTVILPKGEAAKPRQIAVRIS